MNKYIGTTTTTNLMNGSLTEELLLERGLRQCDSLSPFLFLLTTKGLHVMMTTMVESNIFFGYQVGKNEPTVISHVQFVDETLILGGIKAYVRFES